MKLSFFLFFFLILVGLVSAARVVYDNPTLPHVVKEPVYGEMWFHDDDKLNTTFIASANVWYNVSALGNGGSESDQTLSGFTFTNTGQTGVLTAQVTGKYSANYCISGIGGINDIYHFSLAVDDDIKLNTENHIKLSAVDEITTCGTGFLDLSYGEGVTLMLLNTDSSYNFGVNSVNVNLVRIGD